MAPVTNTERSRQNEVIPPKNPHPQLSHTGAIKTELRKSPGRFHIVEIGVDSLPKPDKLAIDKTKVTSRTVRSRSVMVFCTRLQLEKAGPIFIEIRRLPSSI